MDLVACKCAKCDTKLGSFINLWTQIGKRYLTPVAYNNADESLRVTTAGEVRLGIADTLVNGWYVLRMSDQSAA